MSTISLITSINYRRSKTAFILWVSIVLTRKKHQSLDLHKSIVLFVFLPEESVFSFSIQFIYEELEYM